jgi:hypothetical protein
MVEKHKNGGIKMFGELAIIEIIKPDQVRIGDTILFSENIIKIIDHRGSAFIGDNGYHISDRFESYYRVHDKGDRMKINNWKERLIKNDILSPTKVESFQRR